MCVLSLQNEWTRIKQNQVVQVAAKTLWFSRFLLDDVYLLFSLLESDIGLHQDWKMAFIDDPEFVIAHIRHSCVVTDETGNSTVSTNQISFLLNK